MIVSRSGVSPAGHDLFFVVIYTLIMAISGKVLRLYGK